MEQKVITLITDFGLEDEYVGLMKGVILGINSNAKIVDVSHSINPQNIRWACYLLYYSYKYFPKGTVHVVVVDPGVGSDRNIICIKADGHIFLCPDNGVITKVLKEGDVEKAYIVNNKAYFLSEVSNTFHGRDIFAPIAAYLSTGKECSSVGPEIDINEIKYLKLPGVKEDENIIKGELIHIDRFGNIITNIEKDMIDKLGDAEKVVVKISDTEIKGLKKSYQDVGKGKLLTVIGSRGLMEISVNGGSAADRLNVSKSAKVKVCA